MCLLHCFPWKTFCLFLTKSDKISPDHKNSACRWWYHYHLGSRKLGSFICQKEKERSSQDCLWNGHKNLCAYWLGSLSKNPSGREELNWTPVNLLDFNGRGVSLSQGGKRFTWDDHGWVLGLCLHFSPWVVPKGISTCMNYMHRNLSEQFLMPWWTTFGGNVLFPCTCFTAFAIRLGFSIYF